MMPTTNPSVAVVVTSIARPNAALQALARGCQENDYQFIVIGDEASPPDFHLPGCRFYSLDDQRSLPFELARLCPTRHYARKNLGYLIALSEGASLVIETDDDNLPYKEFWQARERAASMPALTKRGWVNVYRYFSDANIWPRGLPLNHILDQPPAFESLTESKVDCPIQQGLADTNPDTDAIYRLTSTDAQYFRKDRRIALTSGSWSPFNSQNTTWWRDAFPLLYLPAFCSFRMTDIWRSFIAQRIAWANDWSVAFHEPTVWQERNEHDLMRDFRDEAVGYLNNEAICRALDELQLVAGVENLFANLVKCYEELARMQILGADELPLLAAWIHDIQSGQPKLVAPRE
jgi:STELLO glycosyltransferase-like protein